MSYARTVSFGAFAGRKLDHNRVLCDRPYVGGVVERARAIGVFSEDIQHKFLFAATPKFWSTKNKIKRDNAADEKSGFCFFWKPYKTYLQLLYIFLLWYFFLF